MPSGATGSTARSDDGALILLVSRRLRGCEVVKFETTPAFDSDYRKFKPEHRTTFRLVVTEKSGPACDAYAADASTPWPSALPVKSSVTRPVSLK